MRYHQRLTLPGILFALIWLSGCRESDVVYCAPRWPDTVVANMSVVGLPVTVDSTGVFVNEDGQFLRSSIPRASMLEVLADLGVSLNSLQVTQLADVVLFMRDRLDSAFSGSINIELTSAIALYFQDDLHKRLEVRVYVRPSGSDQSDEIAEFHCYEQFRNSGAWRLLRLEVLPKLGIVTRDTWHLWSTEDQPRLLGFDRNETRVPYGTIDLLGRIDRFMAAHQPE